MGPTEIEWAVPTTSLDNPSKYAQKALQYATAVAKDFDTIFDMRSEDREMGVPHFEPDEVVISANPIRLKGFCAEYELKAIRLVMDLTRGAFGSNEEQGRTRLAERSVDGHYSIKYLQRGVIETDHGPMATTDMIVETKILMNLAPHPNLCTIYGVNGLGIDSFLTPGRRGFFQITDRITESLPERVNSWRDGAGYQGSEAEFTQRLDVAMDIASALVYLHSRRLVYCIRPEKVGFDARYGRVKLCDFSQARQEGMDEYARSITKSDNIRVLAYTAPEVLCRAPVSLSTDVFGFGILLWEIMSLKTPFEKYNRANHFEQVIRNNERPRLSQKWPNQLKALLKGCWDPHFRPEMKNVHETLEASLLFEEDEMEMKAAFTALRRQRSNSNIDHPPVSPIKTAPRPVTKSLSPRARSSTQAVQVSDSPKRSSSVEHGHQSSNGATRKSNSSVRRTKSMRSPTRKQGSKKDLVLFDDNAEQDRSSNSSSRPPTKSRSKSIPNLFAEQGEGDKEERGGDEDTIETNHTTKSSSNNSMGSSSSQLLRLGSKDRLQGSFNSGEKSSSRGGRRTLGSQSSNNSEEANDTNRPKQPLKSPTRPIKKLVTRRNSDARLQRTGSSKRVSSTKKKKAAGTTGTNGDADGGDWFTPFDTIGAGVPAPSASADRVKKPTRAKSTSRAGRRISHSKSSSDVGRVLLGSLRDAPNRNPAKQTSAMARRLSNRRLSTGYDAATGGY